MLAIKSNGLLVRMGVQINWPTTWHSYKILWGTIFQKKLDTTYSILHDLNEQKNPYLGKFAILITIAHPNAYYPEDLHWPYPYFARRVVVYRVPQNRLMKMMKCQKPHPSLLIWLDNSITEIFSSAILMTGLRLALLPSIPLTYFRFNSNFRTASWWWVLKWTFGYFKENLDKASKVNLNTYKNFFNT